MANSIGGADRGAANSRSGGKSKSKSKGNPSANSGRPSIAQMKAEARANSQRTLEKFSQSLFDGAEVSTEARQESAAPSNSNSAGLLDGIKGWFGGGADSAQESSQGAPQPTQEQRDRALARARKTGIDPAVAMWSEMIKP